MCVLELSVWIMKIEIKTDLFSKGFIASKVKLNPLKVITVHKNLKKESTLVY